MNYKLRVLFIEERQDKILNYINTNEKFSIEEIIEIFKISKSTVRRDLIDLERRNMIIRTRGGALKKRFFKYEFTLNEKKNINLQNKIKITQISKKYVTNGDVIFIGGGTTTYEFAKLLQGFEDLIVFTNACNILSELVKNPNIKVKFLGGNFRRNTLSCVGQDAIDILQRYSFSKSFIGANDVTIEEGATTPNELEARVDGEAIRRSKESFLLVDDLKFGAVAYSIISSLENINFIITNKEPKKEYKEGIINKE